MKFSEIQPLTNFNSVFSDQSLASVPPDWYIIITDVISSTQAIENNRYKEVNTAGGLAVMAVSNQLANLEFPFVFGGDGVTMLLPPQHIEQVQDILVDTSQKVKQLYDLDLRVGVIPIEQLYDQNAAVLLGKLKISQYYSQAIIDGAGVELAEQWIKAENSPYLLHAKENPLIEADFSGFTCRWQDVKSKSGETIALIIKMRSADLRSAALDYRNFIKAMNSIIGAEEDHHPIQSQQMHVVQRNSELQNETRAISGKKSGLRYVLNLLRIRFETLITRLAMRLGLPLKAYWYNLSQIKHYNIISSDFKKYDGTLKMILSVDREQRLALEQLLEDYYKSNKLFYGIHVSDRALLTCLLQKVSTEEVHFVDAADGGYALAAKQLKSQMRQVQSRVGTLEVSG